MLMVDGKLNTKRRQRGGHMRRERACAGKGGGGPRWNLGGRGGKGTREIIGEGKSRNLT